MGALMLVVLAFCFVWMLLGAIGLPGWLAFILAFAGPILLIFAATKYNESEQQKEAQKKAEWEQRRKIEEQMKTSQITKTKTQTPVSQTQASTTTLNNLHAADDNLRKLKALYDDGLLTDEEFEEKRKKLVEEL